MKVDHDTFALVAVLTVIAVALAILHGMSEREKKKAGGWFDDVGRWHYIQRP